MTRQKHAQSSAVDWITKAISGEPWNPGDRLPSIRELASMAGVSFVTMAKAVHELRDKKALQVRPRKGIIVETQQSSAISMRIARPATRSARVKQRLARDILSGRFDNTGSLPSAKELMRMYGVSARTLGGVIRSLQDDEIVYHDKWLWRMTRERMAPSSMTICFFSPYGFADLARNTYQNMRLQSVLYTIEQECARRAVRFSVHSYSEDPQPAIPANAAGFIAWAEPNPGESTSRLLSSLLRWKKPVFIFDEGHIDTTGHFPANDGITLFRIDDYRAGYELGMFLIGKGHRHACFFGEWPAYWVSRRAHGLAAAFNEYEGRLSTYYSRDYDSMPAHPQDRTVRESSRQLPSSMANLVRRAGKSRITQGSSNRLVNFIGWNQYEGALQKTLLPAIRQSLGEAPSATAWIGSHDSFVLDGLRPFLERAGKLLDHQITVCGFNNSLEAFLAHVTSYNFDIAGCAVRMVNLLLDPRYIRLFTEKGNVVPVTGFVCER